MKTQIVVLAAGKGKRMESADVPKVLIALHGKPIISYLLNELKKLKDLPSPVIVVGFKQEMVKDALGSEYAYATQEQQLGTAHAVWAARSKINADSVLVLYGDMPFIQANSLKKIVTLHKNQKAMLSMFTTHAPNFDGMYEGMNGFGRIIRDKYGNIVKITEFKDATDEEKRILEVNPGIYMFNTVWLWDNIDKIQNHNAQSEYYLTDMVELAIEQGHTVESLAIGPEEVFGINTQAHLLEASKLIA